MDYEASRTPGSGCATARLIRQHVEASRHSSADSRKISRPRSARAALLSRIAASVTATLAVAMLTGAVATAQAQDARLAPGDAVVSGFSGIMQSPDGIAAGGSPLDSFFINTDGPSAQILSLYALGGPPLGQLVPTVPKLTLKAGQVGQVFAIALDTTADGRANRFLLGATSAYGVHIAKPDPARPGAQLRLQRGDPQATWMAGMFGKDGGPGTIWQVDARTGAVSVFASLPANSGAGVGDVVIDQASGTVYASDLDTGLIHRFDRNGSVLGTFDHGVAGRPAKGLAAVADDGRRMEITSPAFDTQNTDTWGYTQPERMVYGMAIHGGRLYYAVAGNQIWSIGIDSGGGFSGDARWELDITDVDHDGPVTDMLFDGSGRMYLAFRGQQKGDYEYTAFTSTDKGPVVRYRMRRPSDPPSDSRWSSDKEEYAIAQTPQHRHGNGGISLGYQHDAQGSPRIGTCGSMIWSTGDQLRPSRPDAGVMPAADGVAPPPDVANEADVHGLQGNDIGLVRPANTPPTTSYFVDYDGTYGNPAAIGHVGDVEVLQPCRTDAANLAPPADGWPGYVEPGPDPLPPPPPWQPPSSGYSTNLTLDKWSLGSECTLFGANYHCRFRIRVTNEGPDAYWGAIRIHDAFSTRPPGATITYNSMGGIWSCVATVPGGSEGECQRAPTFLAPGSSVELTLRMRVPASSDLCHLTNTATITHAPGGSVRNTDPGDDTDSASIKIPNPRCPSNTNLQLAKTFDACLQVDKSVWRCNWRIRVTNTGPGVFAGPIRITDTLPAGFQNILSNNPPWNCAAGGGVVTCDRLPTVVPPATSRILQFAADYAVDRIQALGCKIPNTAQISLPAGGSPDNTNAGDDGSSALAMLPAELCPKNPLLQPKAANKPCPDGQVMVAGACRSTGGGLGLVPLPLPPGPMSPPTFSCSTYGMQPVSSNRIGFLRRMRWSLRQLGDGSWCGTPPPRDTEPDGPACNRSERLEMSSYVAGQLRQQGAPVRSISFKGRPAWCIGPFTPVAPPRCMSGWTTIAANQAAAYRAKGYLVEMLSNRSGQTWCARQRPDTVRPPVCPSGWTTIAASQAASYRAKGYSIEVVRNAAGAVWCARQRPGTGPTEPTKPVCINGSLSMTPRYGWLCRCKDGWNRIAVGSSGGARCEPRQQQTCEQKGMVGKYPNCRPRQEPCGPGFTGTKPNCKPIQRPTCEQKGMIGRYPNCRPKPAECGPNQVRLGNRCITRPVACPNGMVGKPPNCRPKPVVCGANQVKVGNRCVNRPVACPRGLVGRPPNCRPATVPRPHGNTNQQGRPSQLR